MNPVQSPNELTHVTSSEPRTRAESKLRDTGVTLRAVLIALILIPINNNWITVIEVRWYALDGTCLPLFVTPIFILFLLALSNLWLRRIWPRIALRRGELLTIYMMVVMGATLASHDLIQNLFGAIGHAHYFANDSNKYESLFFRWLPEPMMVSDKLALKGFYRGGMDPWTWQIMRVWVGPLAWWGVLVLILITMMMCLNILIRRQWTEHEKLVFPLIQLPVEMTSDHATRFYANKLMWGGFGLALVIGLINGLHTLYPSMPYIQWIKQYNIGQFIVNSPWNAVTRGGNGFQISMYPFTIGLGYFIPLDLSFSCWFFYLARKMVQVLGAAMGWDTGTRNQFPYYESQSSGAWLALGGIIIAGNWKYLKGVWRQAFRGDGDNPAEASLYRKAFYGLGIGALMLIGLAHYMGMAAWVAIVFFGIYLVLSIAMTRVRAELGTPHEIYFVNPQQIMVSLLGYNLIGPANLTMIWSMYWFNRCYRSHPMPNQLESFKMAEGTAIKLRPMIFALMLATVVGLLSSYYSNLALCYRDGAQAKCIGYKWWVGHESFERLRDNLITRPGLDIVRVAYMAVGAAIVMGLGALRGAFVGWPFHPAGYALAVSYAMDYFWFAIFVSWLVKLIIVRYGGMRLHNHLVPFFLGLVLGDFFVGSIWAIIGPLRGIQTYKIFI
ncbi:MAG: hypothetical protein N3B12_00055 [Armatimonadetes bacterium]|nr:hypothetical protein [Armatimonadota bacterium]